VARRGPRLSSSRRDQVLSVYADRRCRRRRRVIVDWHGLCDCALLIRRLERPSVCCSRAPGGPRRASEGAVRVCRKRVAHVLAAWRGRSSPCSSPSACVGDTPHTESRLHELLPDITCICVAKSASAWAPSSRAWRANGGKRYTCPHLQRRITSLILLIFLHVYEYVRQ
jgi:hypothetical protein